MRSLAPRSTARAVTAGCHPCFPQVVGASEGLVSRVRGGEELRERLHHLADDGVASMAVEGRVERIDDPVMAVAAALPISPRLLVIGDVVGDDGSAVVLGAGKHLI